MYDQYKAQRKETPETLKPQFAYLKEILGAMSVPVLESEGYEADDLIATVTRRAEAEGMEIIVITGDKDAFQLVSDQTTVEMTIKGISTVECYNKDKLFEKYQLKPEQIIDLKGLMGDPSDNIPGIPGIGEKTALKLLWSFGSLEQVLENVDAVPGNKLKALLKEYPEQALLSKKLATMIDQVPIDFQIGDFVRTKPDSEKTLGLLHQYSLSMICRLFEQTLDQDQEGPARSRGPAKSQDRRDNENGKNNRNNKNNQDSQDNQEDNRDSQAGPSYEERILDPGGWLEQISSWMTEKTELVISYRLEGEAAHLSVWNEMGICDQRNTYSLDRTQIDKNVLAKWHELLGSPRVFKIMADHKTLYSALANEGVRLDGLKYDLSLAAYLMNPTRSSYQAAELLSGQADELFFSAAREAGLLAHEFENSRKKLEELGLSSLLHELEEPLSIVLAEMERQGISVDREMLEQIGFELEKKIAVIEEDIYQIAGVSFNINSPQQLGKVLFEQLELPPLKK